MKTTYKYYKQLIFLALLGILPACDVLDVNPYDKITDEQAYKNKAGIEKGILGSYSELQSLSYYGRAYLISFRFGSRQPDSPNRCYSGRLCRN